MASTSTSTATTTTTPSNDGIGDEATRLCRFVHVHSSLQTIGANWAEVQRTKSQWVREFSRYDAGWSYIGDPFPWKPLENSAAIPNRLSTYVLAGIPIITDRRPGFYRYNEPHRLGVAIDFDGDYGTLRERLESERRSRAGAASARRERSGYSFDATIDPLIGVLDRARTEYFARAHAVRSRFLTIDRRRIVSFGWGVRPPRAVDRVRAVAGAWIRAGQRSASDTSTACVGSRCSLIEAICALAPRLLESLADPAGEGDTVLKVAVLERFADLSRRCEHRTIGGPRTNWPFGT